MTPQPKNHERSENWLKRKGQPRNNKGQFTSSNKNAGEEVDMNMSVVSDEEFDCYNKSKGKLVHTKTDDELQLLPKENNLTLGQGMHKGINEETEPLKDPIDYLLQNKPKR